MRTKEFSYYRSLYSVQKKLGINAGIVKMVSEGKNKCKTGISKVDGDHYSFEYVGEDEMPVKEEKIEWQKKEFKCETCCNICKNSYKYVHQKKCKKGNPIFVFRYPSSP